VMGDRYTLVHMFGSQDLAAKENNESMLDVPSNQACVAACPTDRSCSDTATLGSESSCASGVRGMGGKPILHCIAHLG
jgi:hypothetical protein